MDREGGYKERMRKFFLHFLILSPFPLRFLFISSFSLHFLAARLQGCNDSCSPATAPVKYNSVIGPGTAWIKRIMWSPLANFHNWAV